jgi:hypothetical protein
MTHILKTHKRLITLTALIGIILLTVSVSVLRFLSIRDQVSLKSSHRLTFSTEINGDEAFTITYDITKKSRRLSWNKLEITDAIVDFSLPINKFESGIKSIRSLKRSDVAEEELINSIVIQDVPGDGRAVIVFRFATRGEGEKSGKTGVSMVAGFNLQGDVFNSISLTPIPLSSLKKSSVGKLLYGRNREDGCSTASAYAKQDLDRIGITANFYADILTASASPDQSTSCNSLLGFVLFDPLNKNIHHPYFEFKRSFTVNPEGSEGNLGEWRID